jgi:hypothetical protein
MTEAAFHHLPHPSDSERLRYGFNHTIYPVVTHEKMFVYRSVFKISFFASVKLNTPNYSHQLVVFTKITLDTQ